MPEVGPPNLYKDRSMPVRGHGIATNTMPFQLQISVQEAHTRTPSPSNTFPHFTTTHQASPNALQSSSFRHAIQHPVQHRPRADGESIPPRSTHNNCTCPCSNTKQSKKKIVLYRAIRRRPDPSSTAQPTNSTSTTVSSWKQQLLVQGHTSWIATNCPGRSRNTRIGIPRRSRTRRAA